MQNDRWDNMATGIGTAIKYSGRDTLVDEHRKFVHAVVLTLVRRFDLPRAQLEDFIACGYLGLVEAAQRFDFSTGNDFKNYAYLRIRGAVIDGIRRSGALTGHAYRQVRAAEAAQDVREANWEQKMAGVRRPPSKQRLAEIVDFAAQSALIYRLSVPDVEEELQGNHDHFIDAEHPEETYDRKQFAQMLCQLVEELPEKERHVIESYYYRDKSFVEIANESGTMSKSWISRLHARALERLRKRYLEEIA
jgi:RNA polymerase sigma factor FliA